MSPTEFSQAVLSWFDRHGRKDLPWQQAITPYRVWVSEIMLQQTQVSTVIPYFERFTASFPDVATLAGAAEDQVLSHWSGLGYYARARNLHKTAQIVQQQYRGEFPRSLAELAELPGIGRSTAGAIISLAMQGRAPILDGNVKRVLSRYHAVEGWAGQSATAKQLWNYAQTYTPQQRVAEYTQAMMDLGATLCTRSKPACDRCPLRQDCKALHSGRVTEFPQRKPKRELPSKAAYFMILTNPDGEILLEKRPPQGIWGGLWSLPQHEQKDTLCHTLELQLGCSLHNINESESINHTFSHFHLALLPLHAEIKTAPSVVDEPNLRGWYKPQQLTQVGLAAPIKKLLKSV